MSVSRTNPILLSPGLIRKQTFCTEVAESFSQRHQRPPTSTLVQAAKAEIVDPRNCTNRLHKSNVPLPCSEQPLLWGPPTEVCTLLRERTRESYSCLKTEEPTNHVTNTTPLSHNVSIQLEVYSLSSHFIHCNYFHWTEKKHKLQNMPLK